MSTAAFSTPIALYGPFRAPRQMLANQEYGGHVSLHDDATAKKLGFAAGPIEGPTHFSQFVPLLERLWGRDWFETGCLSIHFKSPCVEGDEVRAWVEVPEGMVSTIPSGTDVVGAEDGAAENGNLVRVGMDKRDGTEVLTGTASIGQSPPESELERRVRTLAPAGELVILADLRVGTKGKVIEHVRMDHDVAMGALYPFSLRDKLAVITEPSPWYAEATGSSSPWGRAIVPLEMVSVLTGYTGGYAGFPVKQPSIGLIGDLEVRMLRGPLFVGDDYALEREVVAISDGRRTESYWVKTQVREEKSGDLIATTLLNHAVLRASYPGSVEATTRG
jgi:acyl dehydratase